MPEPLAALSVNESSEEDEEVLDIGLGVSSDFDSSDEDENDGSEGSATPAASGETNRPSGNDAEGIERASVAADESPDDVEEEGAVGGVTLTESDEKGAVGGVAPAQSQGSDESSSDEEEGAVGYDESAFRVADGGQDSALEQRDPRRLRPGEPGFELSPASVLKSEVTRREVKRGLRNQHCTWCDRWSHLRPECPWLGSSFVPCRLGYCPEAHLNWMKFCPRFPEASNQPQRGHRLDFAGFDPHRPGYYFFEDHRQPSRREDLWRRPPPVVRAMRSRRSGGSRRGSEGRGDRRGSNGGDSDKSRRYGQDDQNNGRPGR